MSNTDEEKMIGEAGAWHSALVQELHKKHAGGDYHRVLVAIGLRHIKRHCSYKAYTYYQNLNDGLCRLLPD